jgi:hypothetical protein
MQQLKGNRRIIIQRFPFCTFIIFLYLERVNDFTTEKDEEVYSTSLLSLDEVLRSTSGRIVCGLNTTRVRNSFASTG